MLDLGCTVEAGLESSKPRNCVKVEGARLFRITDAIPKGWEKVVRIKMKFRNPVDNWGMLGFKIRTYENITNEISLKTNMTEGEYLVDKLESNDLIPNLKCLKPCFMCK